MIKALFNHKVYADFSDQQRGLKKMNVNRFFFGKSLTISGAGMLSMAVMLFLVKLLIDVAYLVAAVLGITGLAMLVIGMILGGKGIRRP